MRRAGDILRVFLDRHTAEQAELYHTFFSAWQQIVGERIAAHSEVKDIDNGVVLVEVDHPGWIQMIQLKQTQFVRSLRRRYPDLNIRGLRLQLPWKAPGSAARQHAPEPVDDETPGEETGVLAEKAGNAPADPLIKGALDRLGKAIEERSDPS